MKQIEVFKKTGSFAENKDVAKAIRIGEIIPALDNKEELVLDFSGVEAVTQSFIHALISDVIRRYGIEVLEKISFKSCNDTVREIISIVVDYMQD